MLKIQPVKAYTRVFFISFQLKTKQKSAAIGRLTALSMNCQDELSN